MIFLIGKIVNMIKEKEITLKKDYSYIKVYRKLFGIWFLRSTIYRNLGKDGLELFRETKKHYRKVYGYDTEYKLELVWKSDIHIFDGVKHKIN